MEVSQDELFEFCFLLCTAIYLERCLFVLTLVIYSPPLFPGLLAEICPKGVEAVQNAVAEVVGRSRDDADPSETSAAGVEGPLAGPKGKQEHVMEQYYASRALRR